MENLLKECVAYFKENSSYKRIFLKLKERYISMGYFGGTIKIENITEKEKEAMENLLGHKFSLKNGNTIKVKDVVNSLKNTKFEKIDFYDILTLYFGEEIQAKKNIDESKKMQKNKFFTLLESSVNYEIYNFVSETFKGKIRGIYDLLNNKYNEDGIGNKLLKELVFLDVIITKINSQLKFRIAILASEVTGNPHNLDENTFLNKLLTYYLCYNNKCEIPKNAEEKNALLYENNILKDDISNNTLVAGVLTFKKEEENLISLNGWNTLALEYEPYFISLKNLSKIDFLESLNGKVVIVENPTVFMKIHSIVEDYGMKITLICSNGQVKLSTLVILDMLSKSNCSFYYSGDYDPEGLLIADKLIKRYKDIIKPIFYSPDIYIDILSNEEINDRRLKQLYKIENDELKDIREIMLSKKKAAYQENLEITIDNIIKAIDF